MILCASFIMMPYDPIYAQEQNSNTDHKALLHTPHALAMHGVPKYGADATHLDYANPDAPKGGVLRQSAMGSFDTLNSHNIKGKPASGLTYLYDRLATRIWDEPFSLYGLIANEIIIPEDRNWIAFKIDPRAQFHDGKSITAADVAFSFETLKTYGRPNTRRVYGLVEEVKIWAPDHIEFRFGEGYDQETAMILAMMPILPEHYWRDKNFDATTLDIPLGSGPYRIKNVDAGRQIIFERVEDYWAKDHLVNVGHHNFDEIIYDYYRDKNVAIQAFKSGKLDIFREFDTASWHNNFIESNTDDFVTEALPHQRPEWVRALIFNTQRAPFDDIKVREALSLSFDFEWMNKTLFHGQTQRITSTFPNTELAHEGNADLLHLDQSSRQRLRLADALLKEAGWEVVNNQRVNKETGAPLEFSVLLNDAGFEKVILHWAQSLKRLGISVDINRADSAKFVGLLNEYDYDVVLHRWVNSLSPGTEQQIYWGCDAAQTLGSRNYSRICDEEIDVLTKKIAQARTREELIENVKTLDHKIIASHLMIPLYFIGHDFVAYTPRLKRPDTTPLYGMVIETWWEAPAQQAEDGP